MVIPEIGWVSPDVPHCSVASLMLPGLAWGEQTWQMEAGKQEKQPMSCVRRVRRVFGVSFPMAPSRALTGGACRSPV